METKSFVYDFQPEEEHIVLIGISKIESSETRNLSHLSFSMQKAVLYVLKHIRLSFPEKYKSGLHIYFGEYNDCLWVGFNYPGSFLIDIFLKYLEEVLPNEYFDIEESIEVVIPMIYTYYPDKIISFNTDHSNGVNYNDEKYGTMLEITSGELFSEDMKDFE